MAIASYTSEYDERKNYREALMDRLAELVIAHHKQLTNLNSIKTSQKVTVDGVIKTGGRTDDDERIVLFRSDLRANDTDAPYIEQILNTFSAYGNTDDGNYGISVNQITLEFYTVDNGTSQPTTVPVLTAPGIPGIELIDLENFFNDNVSQFVDLSVEKQTFVKQKVKEFLNTSFQEILPKNFAMIRKINNWFEEFDLLKNHIEPGIKPLFQTNRELFVGDNEQLTYFVREAVDLLYPQTHPIYTAQNYYNTEDTLIQLDYTNKSEKQKYKDYIDLQTVRSISKDNIIKIITDRIIPLLTDKFTEQLTVEGTDASFSQYQLEQLVLAIRTGNYNDVMGNLIYNQNFEDIDVSPFANDYDISNAVAYEEGVVSQDFHLYKGIPVACKPNQYRSNSTWAVKNQYSGLYETAFTLNQQTYVQGHTHRHFWGERHFWTTTENYTMPDGHFTCSPLDFKVTHPDGTEYNVDINFDINTSGFRTSLDKQSSIANVDWYSGNTLFNTSTYENAVNINQFDTPPTAFQPAGGVVNDAIVNISAFGSNFKLDFTVGFHTRHNSGTNQYGSSTAHNNPSCFLAYVGSNLNRFSRVSQLQGIGLAVILWDGEKWIYDAGNNTIQETRTFKPNYNDFIICELTTKHNQKNFGMNWIGSEESFDIDGPVPSGTGESYHLGNRKGSGGDWIAGQGRGGNWSGYLRKRFTSKGITESWRDHGDPSGTWGLVNVSFPQAPKPANESETSQVLRLTINQRIAQQNKASAYHGMWAGARKYYNWVGHDNNTGLTSLEAGKNYRLFFTIRTSTPNMAWSVKIGDYRNGHENPIWESKVEKVSEDTEWHVYEIEGIAPIQRGQEPNTHLFSQYNYPVQNTMAQICVGVKPGLTELNDSTQPLDNDYQYAIGQAVNEWIEIENIEIYGDNILTDE